MEPQKQSAPTPASVTDEASASMVERVTRANHEGLQRLTPTDWQQYNREIATQADAASKHQLGPSRQRPPVFIYEYPLDFPGEYQNAIEAARLEANQQFEGGDITSFA